MTRKTSSAILTAEDNPEAGSRPFLDQSQSYRVFLQQKQRESQRTVDDLTVEIAGLETQIQAKMQLLGEHTAIVEMSSAALAVNVTANPTHPAKITDRD